MPPRKAAVRAEKSHGRKPRAGSTAPRLQIPLRAVLFDLDGTLVDSMALTFDALRRAARPYLGRLVEDSELVALLGPTETEMLATLVGPNLAPACYARYERLYMARLRYLLRQRQLGLAAGLTSFLGECRRAGLLRTFGGRAAPWGLPPDQEALPSLTIRQSRSSTVSGTAVENGTIFATGCPQSVIVISSPIRTRRNTAIA